MTEFKECYDKGNQELWTGLEFYGGLYDTWRTCKMQATGHVTLDNVTATCDLNPDIWSVGDGTIVGMEVNTNDIPVIMGSDAQDWSDIMTCEAYVIEEVTSPNVIEQFSHREVEPPIEVASLVQVEPPIEVEPPIKVEPPIEVASLVQVEPPIEVASLVQVEPPIKVPAASQVEPPIKVPAAIKVITRFMEGEEKSVFEVLDDQFTNKLGGIAEKKKRKQKAKKFIPVLTDVSWVTQKVCTL